MLQKMHYMVKVTSTAGGTKIPRA